MLPNYIEQELLRRLSPDRALVMAKSVGLDPDRQYAMPDNHQLLRWYEFNGNIEFTATICCQDHAHPVRCRMTFSVELADAEDPDTGRPIRIVDGSTTVLHALIPTGEDEPAFEWVSIPHRLLPYGALEMLDERVEQLAVIMEDGRPSRQSHR